MSRRTAGSLRGLSLVLTWVVVLAMAPPAPAQAPSVDALITRVFAPKHRTPYELTADFSGILTLIVRGSQLRAFATGSFKEWQKAGEPRRRKTSIYQLHLPAVLRPFNGALRSVLEERIEIPSEDPSAFHEHDFFILQAQPESRYVIAGVRRDIVDETIDRYNPSADKQDFATRRAVARWLYTSMAIRSGVPRPGPPYAVEAIVDEAGLIHELTAFYSWGRVSTRFAYMFLNGEPVWREVVSELIGEMSGLGSVNGRLAFILANHCMNCP